MRKQIHRLLAISSIALASLGASTVSNAFPLTITPAGTLLGFSLTTVVSSLNGGTASCCHVLGSAVNSAGQIIVNDGFSFKNYLFANVDNQVGPGAAISSAVDNGFPVAMANAIGTVYAGGGPLRKLNNDGSTATTYTDITVSLGMWTNPVNQHLIAVGSATGVGSGLLDIDVSGPVPVARLINGAGSDGVTVSPDGTIVYTNSAAYRISDGALLGSYFVSGADGMGVITSGNALNGDIIVSTTGGLLVLLDSDNNFAQTIIADSGGYGDFTSPDFTTGTLLVSSGDYLMRLGCGQGCGVGAPPPNVPEPSILWLAGIGLLGLTRVRKSARSEA